MKTKQHRQFSNIVEFSEGEKTLFNVANQRMTDADFKKQIALMEAAQDMLEALEKCRKWYEEHGKDYEIGTPSCFVNAKKVIAAAKGDAKC